MSQKSKIDSLLAPAFFFDFAVPCRYRDPIWTRTGVQLEDTYRIPSFAVLDDRPSAEREPWADVRLAWNESGLAINLRVCQKKQRPWCRASRVDDSDGLAVWIDTRNTPGIHRANRFCHQFRFLPSGGGRRLADPVATQIAIERARDKSAAVGADSLKIRSEKRIDGYVLEALIAADALTGFDPTEHPALGFTYAVYDRELGEHTFALGSEFPYPSDPSLWGTLELVRD